jgi:3-isopropylmalate/(R)-2-methylmalate dehydratase small subunit
MTIDLPTGTIQFGDSAFPASLHSSAREALIRGRWDALGELLEARGLVAERVANLAYMAAR